MFSRFVSARETLKGAKNRDGTRRGEGPWWGRRQGGLCQFNANGVEQHCGMADGCCRKHVWADFEQRLRTPSRYKKAHPSRLLCWKHPPTRPPQQDRTGLHATSQNTPLHNSNRQHHHQLSNTTRITNTTRYCARTQHTHEHTPGILGKLGNPGRNGELIQPPRLRRSGHRTVAPCPR